MKAGLSIQELGTELRRRDEAKLDYLVHTGSLHMDAWGTHPMLRVSDAGGTDLVEPLDILPTAHRQLGDYLGIPKKYYDRMLSEDTELLTQNVNRWLRREPELRILRTIDGQTRAFLSNRYRCIDHLDLVRVVLPIIGEMPEAQYVSCDLTDDFMYIKVVNPRLTADVVPGDTVQAGVIISNSETGQGSVCIQPLIYRLVCSNGMVVNDATDAEVRRIHKGRAYMTDAPFQIHAQESLTASDGDFISKLQNTVRTAIDEAKLLQVLGKMRESKEMPLNTENLPQLIKLTGASFKVHEDEQEGIMRHLVADQDFTLYGLANAITRYSQDVPSYDRATKLEGIGYDVLNMPRDLFRRINQAAGMAA